MLKVIVTNKNGYGDVVKMRINSRTPIINRKAAIRKLSCEISTALVALNFKGRIGL